MRPSHSNDAIRIQLLSLLTIFSLVTVNLCSLPSPVLAQKTASAKKKKQTQPTQQPDHIEFKMEPDQKEPLSLGLGDTINVRALVIDKQGEVMSGTVVTWQFSPDSAEGDKKLISLTHPLNNITTSVITITGIGKSKAAKQIKINANSPGVATKSLSITYTVAPLADVSEISLKPDATEIKPGGIVKITATVKQGDIQVKDKTVNWTVSPDMEQYVRKIAEVNDPQKGNSLELVGLSTQATADKKPISVPVVANVGEKVATVVINYKTDVTEKPKPKANKVTISQVDGDAKGDLSIAPGYALRLKATIDDVKADSSNSNTAGATTTTSNSTPPTQMAGGNEEKPRVTWSVPDAMSQFVTLTPDKSEPNIVTITALFGKPGAKRPPVIPVRAIYGDAMDSKDINYLGTVDEVDVSWDVIPQHIVSTNFGRSIRKEFYCIELVIGNNTGSDLQLAGIGFEIPQVAYQDDGSRGNANGRSKKYVPKKNNGITEFAPVMETVRDASGIPQLNTDGTPRRRVAYDSDGNEKFEIAGILPVSSYATVRGVLAERQLTHPRAITLASANALGELLGGFKPFFVNPIHGNHFSNWVNIVSNPLAKGIENVWKDAYPGELDRLDQQTLRDDKIIGNNTTYKTRVFIPKDALFVHGEKDRDDVREVRRRLGVLLLVGHIIERKGFVNRQRFGPTPTAQ